MALLKFQVLNKWNYDQEVLDKIVVFVDTLELVSIFVRMFESLSFRIQLHFFLSVT